MLTWWVPSEYFEEKKDSREWRYIDNPPLHCFLKHIYIYIYMARHFMIYITQAHRKINVICDIDEATNQCKMSITCHKGSSNVVFSVANCLRVLTSPKRSTSVCMTYSCRPWCFPRRTHLCTTILITKECGFRFAMRISYVHLSIFQLHSRRQVD